MKGNDGIQNENLTKKKVSGINRDVVVFAFFLFLSFVFWYLNSLGKDTEADIRYAVSYTNLPIGRVITVEPPGKLNLYLKGPGYAILKLRLSGNSSPVKIDFSKVNYKRVPGSNSFNYYIVSSGLTRSFSVQLRSECEIISIKPDTLFFTLDRSISKSASFEPDNKSSHKSNK